MESVVCAQMNKDTSVLSGVDLLSPLVSCSVGTFYSGEQEQCVQCPPGTYQDTLGQLSCEPCPSSEGQGITGAKNVSQCGGNAHPIIISHSSSMSSILHHQSTTVLTYISVTLNKQSYSRLPSIVALVQNMTQAHPVHMTVAIYFKYAALTPPGGHLYNCYSTIRTG